MTGTPTGSDEPVRRDRRRLLVLVDVAGYVLVCGLITGSAQAARVSAQAHDPYGYAGLTPFIVSLAFGLPIVPIAVTSILLGLRGGRRAQPTPGRWAGFRPRVGQLALASTIGCLAVVVIGVMFMMIFGLIGGNPGPAIGGALGLGGIALALALFMNPVMLGICVATAALTRLLFGGPGATVPPRSSAL